MMGNSGFLPFIINVATLIGVAVTAAVWIFKRGKVTGLAEAADIATKDDIKTLCTKVDNAASKEDIKHLDKKIDKTTLKADMVHASIGKKIDTINDKVSTLQGSFTTFKEMVKEKL